MRKVKRCVRCLCTYVHTHACLLRAPARPPPSLQDWLGPLHIELSMPEVGLRTLRNLQYSPVRYVRTCVRTFLVSM